MLKKITLALICSLGGSLLAAPAAPVLPKPILNMPYETKHKMCVAACQQFQAAGHALPKSRLSFSMDQALPFTTGRLFILITNEDTQRTYHCSYAEDTKWLEVWTPEDIAKGKDELHALLVAQQKASHPKK
jgi:hypothetical protein